MYSSSPLLLLVGCLHSALRIAYEIQRDTDMSSLSELNFWFGKCPATSHARTKLHPARSSQTCRTEQKPFWRRGIPVGSVAGAGLLGRGRAPGRRLCWLQGERPSACRNRTAPRAGRPTDCVEPADRSRGRHFQPAAVSRDPGRTLSAQQCAGTPHACSPSLWQQRKRRLRGDTCIAATASRPAVSPLGVAGGYTWSGIEHAQRGA
jgi:hypothetical protein